VKNKQGEDVQRGNVYRPTCAVITGEPTQPAEVVGLHTSLHRRYDDFRVYLRKIVF